MKRSRSVMPNEGLTAHSVALILAQPEGLGLFGTGERSSKPWHY
ncbi:MAG: hypothetical protein ABW101_19160 [Candidatus Thiodiazotropha sp.]